MPSGQLERTQLPTTTTALPQVTALFLPTSPPVDRQSLCRFQLARATPLPVGSNPLPSRVARSTALIPPQLPPQFMRLGPRTPVLPLQQPQTATPFTSSLLQRHVSGPFPTV